MGEISVWVKGHQKQLGGLSHKTTAAEIVSFVLSECVWSTTEKARRSGRCYALFENWRGCQRLIPPWKRIYKLWKLWGLERIHVKFVVKKVAMETLARKDFGEYVEASQLKIPKRHVALRMEPHAVADDESEYTTSSDGTGLYLLNDSDGDGGQSPKTRRRRTLLKQVVRQNEQLKDISQTVDDVDEEILFYEAKLHHYRVVEGGKDYVQQAYLAEQGKWGLHKQNARKSPRRAIRADVATVSNGTTEGEGPPFQNSVSADEKTPKVKGREHVDQNANTHENSNRKLGTPEVILGKKNGTKVLVVNPLPRDDHSETTQENSGDEGLKGDDIIHHHLDQKKGMQLYESKPSFRSTKRTHKHGGRVKKRMPGLYEFEQSCEWLKVMDKELKRLESLENLSFVDWDSESLLSDKELRICGNRRFKFRNRFSISHGKPVSSGAIDKGSTDANQLSESFSDLKLGHRSSSPPSVLDVDELKSQVHEKGRDEGKNYVDDIPKSVSKDPGTASPNLGLSRGGASFEVNSPGDKQGVSATPMDVPTQCTSEFEFTGQRSDDALLSKKKLSPPVSNIDGSKEKSGDVTPDESVAMEAIKRNYVNDHSFIASSIPCAKKGLPQSSPAVIKIKNSVSTQRCLEKANSKSAPRLNSAIPFRGTNHKEQKDHPGNMLSAKSAKEDHWRTHSSTKTPIATCLSSEPRISRPQNIGPCQKAASRGRPVAECTTKLEPGKGSGECSGMKKMGSVTQCEFKVPNISVPEPQSSPVSVRRVPKPPIYYPSEDPGPVRHNPATHKQTLSSKSVQDGRKHIAVSTISNQKCNVPAALHPRVEQLRSCKVDGKTLSVAAKTSCEIDSDEMKSSQHNSHSPKNNSPDSFAVQNKNHKNDLAGKMTAKVGQKHVYFEDEQPPQRKPVVASTPVKSRGSNPNTSRVRSPDQGLGQEIPSPADRNKNQENLDSGSDTGLSSVHSQDSGISNASVVIETWV